MQSLSFSAWLISLSIMGSMFIHVVTNGKIASFSWLNNIPLCLRVYIHIRYCVHMLWITLQWTWEYRCVFESLFSFPLDIYPEVELPDMLELFLIFWGTSILYSTVISINRVGGSPYLYILTDTHQHLLSSGWQLCNRCEVIYLIMILIYISLMIINVEHLFLNMLVICMSFLEKCLFKASAPIFLLKFFDFLFCFPIQLYYIFWILTPYQIYDLQIFSPALWAAFPFCWWFPLLCRSCQSDGVPLVHFDFSCLCFRYHIQKTITKTTIKEFMPFAFFKEFYGFRSYMKVFNPFWVDFFGIM